MRREQILKICLNHALSSDILFKEKDEKSWMWAAQDYSEDEGRKETFVVRFRDGEISKSFMEAILRSKVKLIFICFWSLRRNRSSDILFLNCRMDLQVQQMKVLLLLVCVNFIKLSFFYLEIYMLLYIL